MTSLRRLCSASVVILDQLVLSATSVLITIFMTRTGGAEGAVVALVSQASFVLVVTFGRVLITEPLLTLPIAATVRTFRGMRWPAVVLVSAMVGSIGLGAVVDGTLSWVAAVACVGLLQDVGRMILIRLSKHHLVLGADVLVLIVLAVVFAFGASLFSILVAWLVGLMLSASILWWCSLASLNGSSSVGFESALASQGVTGAHRVRAADGLLHLSALQLPLLACGLFMTPAAAANLRIATTLFGPLQTASVAFSMYVLPRVADAPRNDILLDRVKSYWLLQVLASVAFAVLCVVFMGPIFSVFGGNVQSDTGVLLVVGLFSVLLVVQTWPVARVRLEGGASLRSLVVGRALLASLTLVGVSVILWVDSVVSETSAPLGVGLMLVLYTGGVAALTQTRRHRPKGGVSHA